MYNKKLLAACFVAVLAVGNGSHIGFCNVIPTKFRGATTSVRIYQFQHDQFLLPLFNMFYNSTEGNCDICIGYWPKKYK